MDVFLSRCHSSVYVLELFILKGKNNLSTCFCGYGFIGVAKSAG